MLTAEDPQPPELVLASTSPYRAELLQRLHLPFRALGSQVDETPRPGETAETLVARLALAKARALQPAHPQAWIIGADQAAVIDAAPIGKPGTRARAIEQLRAASGRSVRFVTGVALLTPQRTLQALDITTVRFRRLADDEISRYVDAEPAFDCAGSFKCEGYGITLFEAIDSRDPTALIGLPLIEVCRLLREAGRPLP